MFERDEEQGFAAARRSLAFGKSRTSSPSPMFERTDEGSPKRKKGLPLSLEVQSPQQRLGLLPPSLLLDRLPALLELMPVVQPLPITRVEA